MMRLPVNKGIIMIFIIGILAVLICVSLIGYNLAVVTMKMSLLSVHRIKAEFASYSGVHYALANIFKPGNDWIYWGEDFNKNYQLDEGEDLNSNSNLDSQSAILDGNHMPSLYKATYMTKKGNIHFSGEIPGEAELKILFILKIVDESNKVYAKPLNDIKIRFLRNLSSILNIDLPDNFSSIEDLKNTLSYGDFLRLSSYINFGQGLTQKFIYPRSELKEDATILTRLQLLPSKFVPYDLELLNINTAPPEIITANLMNLEALYFSQDNSSYKLNFTPKDMDTWDYWQIVREKSHLVDKIMNIGRQDKGPIKLGIVKRYQINLSKVHILTEKILERRKKINFISYADIYNYLSELSKSAIIDELDRDLVFSNIYPNPPFGAFSQFKGFNIIINKENIVTPTLPFSFTPQGTFSIESLGQVYDIKTGELLSNERIRASAKLRDFISFRTYKDFSEFKFSGLDIYPLSKEFSDKLKIDLNSFVSIKFYDEQPDKETVFYASNYKPKSIEVDTEDLADLTPQFYKTYKPFFTTEGIYSGQGHFLKIPASAINTLDLKDIAQGMVGCDTIKDLLGIDLGKGCGQAIKGSISFLYKPLFDTVNTKKVYTIFSVNNYKNGKVSALNVFPYISRKFWVDYFPAMEKFSVGAPAWLWQSYRVGFYFVAAYNTEPEKEVVMQGKWTHFKLIFDTSNYTDVSQGARIYINGKDASSHLGFTTTIGLTGGIFGVPDYFTNNFLRFGASYKEDAWNFPQDAIYNRIKVTKSIAPPIQQELYIEERTDKLELILPDFTEKTFVSSIYIENFKNLAVTVNVIDEKKQILYNAKGIDLVTINNWIYPGYTVKIIIEPKESETPVITGIIIGTLKGGTQFLEFTKPSGN